MPSKYNKNILIGVNYKSNTVPIADVDIFTDILYAMLDTIDKENKFGILMGDMNIDLLKTGCHCRTGNYLDNLFSHIHIGLSA